MKLSLLGMDPIYRGFVCVWTLTQLQYVPTTA